MYTVIYTRTATKALQKMDISQSKLIIGWIEKNLEGCINPRIYGKALAVVYKGTWRYRVGNYRLIADIQDENITILLLNVGHRREVY